MLHSICVIGGLCGLLTPPFELRDGDRVVFVGDTLIEREQYYGWIELALTTRYPDRNITFRNLGWSADTPAGESRCGLSLLQAGHEPPEEGWRQLQNQLREVRPTVVILGYGMASSFAGEKGLPQFIADMKRLMDSIQDIDKAAQIRFILLSPIPHLHTRSSSLNAIGHNAVLSRHAEWIRDLAAERKAAYVSLFDGLKNLSNQRALTENGIHLNSSGYRTAAELIEVGLGWPPGAWRDSSQTERLRQAILKKNEWFFHRSRPANMAYIFGFRKAEQGRNATEIPQFDPLIEEEEKKIAKLRTLKPVELPPGPAPRTESMAAKFTPQPHPTFDIADGLEVTLWAENPMLHKPIQMNFDAQGRLWVASSEVYPQIEPGQTANDKIIILEDTTGQGKADKSTVFADGLLIPTGLEPGDGGVYVAQSTELLHFADTKRTGKADTRRIVLSGFGTEDTHHNLHTLRWGPDGRLYLNQSIYTRTDTETPHGVFRHKSGGVMRFDPRSVRMEILFKGWWNSWGHQFDVFGQSFITDGAGGDGISYGLPGEMHEGYARARRLLGSISPGGYPKFCGLEIVESTHFPDDWQGNIITCDFRANRVVRFQISEDGAGYAAKPMPDVVRSKEISFRPIDVKLGPDGALYIADWSNPIINHGEVDFRDPRRDREHGRIWRVTVKGRQLNPKPKLIDAENRVLFATLLSPNSYDRAQARRALIERGPSVLADLDNWRTAETSEPALLQALWLKQAFDQVDVPLLRQVLSAKDGRIRAAAVRVLGDWIAQVPVGQSLLTERLNDEHPRVRMEAVRSIAKIPNAAAAEAALHLLDRPMDRFHEYALWLTVNDLAEPWLDSLATSDFHWQGREKALEYGLAAVEPAKAGKALAKLLDRHPLTHDGRGPWIELIGQAGGAAELRRLFERVVTKGFDEWATSRALTALGEAARLRGAKPAGDLQALGRFLQSGPAGQRIVALRLAGRWRLPALAPQVIEVASNKAAPADVRSAALEALRNLRGQEIAHALQTLADDDKETADLRRHVIVVLAVVDRDSAVPRLRKALRESFPESEATAFWRSLLSVTGIDRPMAEALRQEPIPVSTAAIGLRIARENADRHRDLVQILERLSGIPAPKEYSAAEIGRIAALAKERGNPARGELVYRRPELRCLACHAIGGAGGKVGPDLTSIGASAPIDYLTESIYLPNKQIKEGFHAILLATSDGKTVTGIPVREGGQEIVLRDADDKLVTVAKKDIEQRGQAGSLMPAGLIDNLFEGERLDLIRFLAELGKPGPYDATKTQAARLWRVLSVANLDAATKERARHGDVTLSAWTSIPSLVGGGLLKAEVQTVKGSEAGVFLATRFEMTKAHEAKLQLHTEGIRGMWLDGKPIQFTKELHQNLSAGTHTLVAECDLSSLPDRIALRSADVVFRTD